MDPKNVALVFLGTCGTVLGGFAQDIYTLLVFRVIQGVAVALVPVSIRIARDLFPKEKFPMAQGIILSMYQGGSAIGLVLGAAVVYFGGWQAVFFSAIPFSILLFFLLWKIIPKVSAVPNVGKDKDGKDIPKRHGKAIDIPGVITLVLTVSTFMLAITFLGKGAGSLGLFWTFLAIGVTSIIAFFMIENGAIPLKLETCFSQVKVGNWYLMLGVVQHIIFSLFLRCQTVEPYG